MPSESRHSTAALVSPLAARSPGREHCKDRHGSVERNQDGMARDSGLILLRGEARCNQKPWKLNFCPFKSKKREQYSPADPSFRQGHSFTIPPFYTHGRNSSCALSTLGPLCTCTINLHGLSDALGECGIQRPLLLARAPTHPLRLPTCLFPVQTAHNSQQSGGGQRGTNMCSQPSRCPLLYYAAEVQWHHKDQQ